MLQPSFLTSLVNIFNLSSHIILLLCDCERQNLKEITTIFTVMFCEKNNFTRGVYFPENLKNFPTPRRKILKSFPIFVDFFVAPRKKFQVFTPFSDDFFPFSMLFLPHLLFPSHFFCFSYLFFNLYLFFYIFPREFSTS